jgi:hypothetical protein
MSKVRGVKVTLKQVINSDAPNAAFREWVTPKKATILSSNGGTLVEAEEGGLFIIPVGDWFRSPYQGRSMPQVDSFNELQDYGLTAIKDKIVRHSEKAPVVESKEEAKPEIKPEIKPTVKTNGQTIRGQSNVGLKKANQTVAPNIKSEKKD